MSLPSRFLTYPVLIEVGGRTGTGFYLNNKNALYLVTACHVLFDNGIELVADRAQLVSLEPDTVAKNTIFVECKSLLSSGALKKHPKSDIAVCKIGSLAPRNDGLFSIEFVEGVTEQHDGHLRGLDVNNTALLADVVVSNDVFLFGYPTSLGSEAQIDPKYPLLRKGIIAGKTADKRIVVDCPVYFGNSGGLVVEIKANGVFGVGVAIQMIPFVEELWSKQHRTTVGRRLENSGYALVEPIDRVLELLSD